VKGVVRKSGVSYDINDLLGTTLTIVPEPEIENLACHSFWQTVNGYAEPGSAAPLEVPVAPTNLPNLQQKPMKVK